MRDATSKRVSMMSTTPYCAVGEPAAKAQEFLAQNRVILEPGDFPYVALVAGAHGHYAVEFLETGPVCQCPARIEWCSHALAAAAAFYEEGQRFVGAPKPPW